MASRRRTRLRLLLSVLAYPALGAVAALAVGWTLAGLTDPRAGAVTTSQAFDDDSDWTLEVARRPGSVMVVSSHAARAWSPRQATGAPDSPAAGDQQTAWATQQQDADGEWLELTYARAVVPKAVHVCENDAPGAVCRVAVYAPDGREVDAWQGKDPSPAGTAAGVAVSRIPLAADFPVARVRLYLDSKGVVGWNEVDAVGLEDAAGQVQWAARAKASSWYGGGTPDPVALAAARSLVPSWSEVMTPDPSAPSSGPAQYRAEDRVAVAFGWPVPAVWGERSVAPAAPTPVPAVTTYLPVSPALGSGLVSGSGTVVLPSSGSMAIPPGRLTGSGGSITYLGGYPTPPAAWMLPTPVTVATAPLPPSRRVLWRGLVVDALVFGAILAAGRWLLVWPQRWVREVSRVRMGRCLRCGYDLGYDFIHGCPECGWRRADGPVEADRATLPMGGANGRAAERVAVPAGGGSGPGYDEAEVRPGG